MRFFYDKFARFAVLLLILSAAGTFALAQDRNPVIIIPGITGSELINDTTGETVWLSIARSKVDDIRLPIITDPLKSRDGLVAGDILRSVKLGLLPRVDVYQGLIDALVKQGYHEETWKAPGPNADRSSVFVFPYDWRLDNVQNAQLLVDRVESVKKKLAKPELKFDIIAHSMGGLIARYAAMYGSADLPPAGRKAVPTWAGDKLFGKIVLLGTPNEGSPLTLEGFINGETFGPVAINLPFVRNISRFDVFTMPAAYELLPAPGTFRLMDADMKQISVDLYDPKVWAKYGWDPIEDPKFDKTFTSAERKAAPIFFAKMLERAKLFHEALSAVSNTKPSVEFALVGSECKETVNGAALQRSAKNGEWITRFAAPDRKKKDGNSAEANALRAAIYSPGDGIVSTYSFMGRGELSIAPASTKFFCEGHNSLAANSEIQEYLIKLLIRQT
ncbi:MAG TPA: hypothetical protein PLR83_04860 [Pyrinomonadaceae bacterium]|nr:hypothetical protein [Pyrinomonadaceae bacterium]